MAARERPATDELSSGPEPERSWRAPGRLVQALGAVALVIGAAVVGPDLLAASGDRAATKRDRPSAGSSPEGAGARPTTAPAALPAWGIRGDLTMDRAFVAAARGYVRKDRPDSSAAVLFAGTLPDGGRVVLVAFRLTGRQNPDDPGVEVHALHLRPGQSVTDGRLEFTGNLRDASSWAGWAGRGRDRRMYAVVVGPAAPLEAEVSAVIDYEPDGSASRSWHPFTARDGAAVIDLGTRTDRIAAVRPLSDEAGPEPLLIRTDSESGVRSRAAFFAFGPEDILGVYDDSYAGPEAIALVYAVGEVTQSIFEPASADIRVIWSGSVDSVGRGALLRARLPDGPTFHVFVEAGGTSSTYSASVRRVRWADADVTPWLLVRPDSGDPILLINPSGEGTVLLQYDGRSRQVQFGADGIAELATERFANDVFGATATIFSPTGERVVRSVLTHPGQDDIFVLR